MRMRNLALFIASAALCSCGTAKHTTSMSESKDSVRIEYRERLVEVPVYIKVPEIKEVNMTRDSTSHLENDWSESTATVQDGILTHTLETKPREIETPATIVVRDTIIVREKADVVTKEVVIEVEKPLSGWTRFWRGFGYVSALAILGYCVWLAVRSKSKILALAKKLLSLK